MDKYYMQMALSLALKARGRTSPNPLVGAIIVKEKEIVGKGYHRRAGLAHAEINALKMAGENARGATLYVTLEPCAHFGRTPPCCEAIIKAGLKRVVIATLDPNPKVSGRGVKWLRQSGIAVSVGCLGAKARKINEVFFKWIATKQPWLILKCALSLDGKTATCAGESKWITKEAARRYVHVLRDRCDAIMVGINTVLCDDPSLTTRFLPQGKNPVRIIVDSKGRLPLDKRVVCDKKAPTIFATTEQAAREKLEKLREKGVEIMLCSMDEGGKVDLNDLCQKLGQREICSVLVEGGASLLGSFVERGLGDMAYFFLAPKLLGGEMARPAVAGKGIASLDEALFLKDMKIKRLGKDILLYGHLRGGKGGVYRIG